MFLRCHNTPCDGLAVLVVLLCEYRVEQGVWDVFAMSQYAL